MTSVIYSALLIEQDTSHNVLHINCIAWQVFAIDFAIDVASILWPTADSFQSDFEAVPGCISAPLQRRRLLEVPRLCLHILCVVLRQSPIININIHNSKINNIRCITNHINNNHMKNSGSCGLLVSVAIFV